MCLGKGNSISPAFLNPDLIENHFCQKRGICNGQNTNLTIKQYGPSNNAIILGQCTMSTKRNSTIEATLFKATTPCPLNKQQTKAAKQKKSSAMMDHSFKKLQHRYKYSAGVDIRANGGWLNFCTCRKAVLRGGIDAEICSGERFQPFPIRFYTNVSTHCIYLKSFCNEKGQVAYDHGNRNTDTTCRCDYRHGFDFVIKPKNLCFCKPSQEDCSCYLKICSNTSQILSPDYQCIDKTDLTLVAQCRSIPDENGNSSRRPEINDNIPDEDNISFLVYTFCEEPPSNITLYEGESFQLRYKTHTGRDFHIYKKDGGIYNRLKSKINVLIEDKGRYYAVSVGVRSKYTLLTVLPLKIKGPGENIRLIEGQSFVLEYILPTNRFRLLFLKNNSKRAETEYVEKNVFKIRQVAPDDEGELLCKSGERYKQNHTTDSTM
ncbi:unnamed protein product [Mytilus coruscus]|uniref:Uncharacterized protein n=1 Tax=Mytilus coruscus TaxID=42192 RepID=A0A6J8A8T1_MYTCO|nr:unnamed protein product [Mytilus coruscus]